MIKAAVITQETGPSSGVTAEPPSPTRPGIKPTLASRLTPSRPPFSPKGPTPFSPKGPMTSPLPFSPKGPTPSSLPLSPKGSVTSPTPFSPKNPAPSPPTFSPKGPVTSPPPFSPKGPVTSPPPFSSKGPTPSPPTFSPKGPMTSPSSFSPKGPKPFTSAKLTSSPMTSSPSIPFFPPDLISSSIPSPRPPPVPSSIPSAPPPSTSTYTTPSNSNPVTHTTSGPTPLSTSTLTPSSTSTSISTLTPSSTSTLTPSSTSTLTPSSTSTLTPSSTSSPITSFTSGPASSSIADVTPSSISCPILPSPSALTRSPHPGISILEKLIKTCPVWLQLGMAPERASGTLQREGPGIFLVRKNTSLKSMVLSVRLSDQEGAPQVQDLLIKEEKSLMYLEGSVLVFDDIFKLIAFYCVSRDILPFTLRLPQAITQATKYEDMDTISNLGSGFWTSSLNRCSEEGRGCSRRADPRSQGHDHDHAHHCSCEIELSMGNDRLWYVNPIFIEEYCGSQPQAAPISRSQSLTTPGQAGPKYKRPPPLPPRPHTSEELSPATKQAKDPVGGTTLPIIAPAPPSPTSTAATKQEVDSNGVDVLAQPPQSQQGSSDEACVSAQLLACSTEGTDPAAQPPQGSSDRACPSAQLSACSSEETGPVAQPPQKNSARACPSAQPQPQRRIPPVPPRCRPSKKQLEEPAIEEEGTVTKEEGGQDTVAVATLICFDDLPEAELPPAGEEGALQEESTVPSLAGSVSMTTTTTTTTATTNPDASKSPARPKKPPPVPPPRKKRPSQLGHGEPEGDPVETTDSAPPQTSSTPTPTRRSISAGDHKGADVSLYSPEGRGALLDHDSYSTSSAEEEAPAVALVTVRRSPTVILDRAKQRLSMVNLTNVFTGFMSADRKLKKRVVELARDGDSYFGSLVRDYRAFTLETMRKHASSTEMLQEIRLMMTQLKCYLVQSAELQTLVEPTVYPEEKLEAIIESALCKSVLKPLRDAVYSGLRDIHTRDESLRKLEENQQVVLGTTTTELGITTSVPEAPVMEKIQLKLASLHKEYSPEKKIAVLLKTCKIIYEAMSVGCPGKPHGADDFLPVLMYVVARSNMVALLLDVEYMMELMDPALQLGEGSYYLTTTYGALEHLKNYGRLEEPQQLSLEIQDSIHRWERRRTLNKARLSGTCVQDFINVSFLEAGSNTKTLGARRDTTAKDLCLQCAEKFEVLEPESYTLCVLLDGQYRPLAPSELPLSIKSSLHHSEPRREYFFVYRPGSWAMEATPPPQPPPTPPPDSLI